MNQMLAESMISTFFFVVNVKVEFMHLVLVTSDMAVRCKGLLQARDRDV